MSKPARKDKTMKQRTERKVKFRKGQVVWSRVYGCRVRLLQAVPSLTEMGMFLAEELENGNPRHLVTNKYLRPLTDGEKRGK